MRVESPQDNSIKYLYKKMNTSNKQQPKDNGLEESWLKIKTNIQNAAMESLWEKTVNRNKKF